MIIVCEKLLALSFLLLYGLSLLFIVTRIVTSVSINIPIELDSKNIYWLLNHQGLHKKYGAERIEPHLALTLQIK